MELPASVLAGDAVNAQADARRNLYWICTRGMRLKGRTRRRFPETSGCPEKPARRSVRIQKAGDQRRPPQHHATRGGNSNDTKGETMRIWLLLLGLAILASAGILVGLSVEARMLKDALLDLRGGHPEGDGDA